MLDAELRKAGPPVKFDNSMRAAFESCPRQFYWWRRGYTYAGSEKPAFFTFGSAWGIMQGLWHDSEGPHLPPGNSEWKEAAQSALQIGLRYWDSKHPVEKGSDTRANLEALFWLYLEDYSFEPFRMVRGGAEKGWLWPLNESYFLGGSTDGYLKWEGLGTMIKEDKTTSVFLNDQYVRQWRFSNQITGYIWYHHKLTGDAGGCLMNMASKRITKAGATPQFARNIERRSAQQLKEFEEGWLYTIRKIEDNYEGWIWPKTANPINCVGGIGKSQCLYQPLCLSDRPFIELDPLNFPGIALDETPWAPWEWKDPLREMLDDYKKEIQTRKDKEKEIPF